MHQDRAESSEEAQVPPASRRASNALGLPVLVVLALPWLNPTAGGPSAVVQPWLVAATATVLAWHLAAPAVTRAQLGFTALAAALLAAAGQAAPPVLLAIGGLLVIAISAAIAASSATRGWGVQAIVDAWLVAALVSSVIALAQYFGYSAQLAPWANPTEAGEAFANLRQRNQFATLTSIGLASLLWRVHQGAKLSWALAAAALLAAANAASASRTGALQILLLVVLTFWWKRPARRGVGAVCLAAVLAYGLAAVLLPVVLQQVAGISAPNAFLRLGSTDGCASRAILWGNVVHLIAQKPWWGWGWGELDYAHFATLYPGARFCDILDNAHNLPLHLAVELGVPMALLACAGVLAWFAWQRPWRETDPTRRMAWAVIAVLLLHSLLEYPLWYGPFQMAFGFSIGLLAYQPRIASGKLIGATGRLAVTALLACALLFTGWDYLRISQLYTAPEERSALFRNRPLPRIGDSWLFGDQVDFALLSITPLTRANADTMNALAMELLHYSPEPRVIDMAIQSAMVLGREDQALWLLERYRAAFPDDAAASAVARRPAAAIRN